MSQEADVGDTVRKYRAAHPNVPRDFLRKHIRLELGHKKIPFTEALEKKLDRELAKAFSQEEKKKPSVLKEQGDRAPQQNQDVLYVLDALAGYHDPSTYMKRLPDQKKE